MIDAPDYAIALQARIDAERYDAAQAEHERMSRVNAVLAQAAEALAPQLRETSEALRLVAQSMLDHAEILEEVAAECRSRIVSPREMRAQLVAALAADADPHGESNG